MSRAIPPVALDQEGFACLTPNGFNFVFRTRIQVAMCGDWRENSENIVPVWICIDAAGVMWGWWSSTENSLSMIFPTREQVEMCFPYGPEVEIKRGHGDIVRVRVERRH